MFEKAKLNHLLEDRAGSATSEEIGAIIFIYDGLSQAIESFEYSQELGASHMTVRHEVERRLGARAYDLEEKDVSDKQLEVVEAAVNREVADGKLNLSAEKNRIIENAGSSAAKTILKMVDRIVANPDGEIKRVLSGLQGDSFSMEQ